MQSFMVIDFNINFTLDLLSRIKFEFSYLQIQKIRTFNQFNSLTMNLYSRVVDL